MHTLREFEYQTINALLRHFFRSESLLSSAFLALRALLPFCACNNTYMYAHARRTTGAINARTHLLQLEDF